MYARKTTIINRLGLHARVAAAFVGKAESYSSEITLKQLDENGEEVKSCPVKSIVFLIAMGLKKGTAIQLTAEGEDEQEAVDALVGMIDAGFGEE